MNLYLDTSALVKLYVEEVGSQLVRWGLDQAELVATSEIAYLEARAALARRRREKAFSLPSYRRLLEEFELDWDRFVVVDVTMPLLRDASSLAEQYPLRAMDALHLASAQLIGPRSAEESLMFASWDDALDRAAKREGLALLRETKPR
jgi:predicted nucleic acid-binding protein